MLETLTLALWATNMGLAIRSRDAFLAVAERMLDRARAAGAELALFPEHLGELWLQWAPAGLPETEEIPWIAEEARAIVPALMALARARGLALLAGTFPARAGTGYRNRAWLGLPDGSIHLQDKLTLTPDERDPAAWMLEPGDTLELVCWRGLRIAVLICLDVEQPGLAARLAADPPDLVLVPTDTGRLSGYHRVTACARARAVELYAAVAVAGGVGTVPVPPERPNVSGAGLYLPCEMAFGATGVWAETGPLPSTRGDGPLLIARDVPLGELRRRRVDGAEVWPGYRSCAPESLRLLAAGGSGQAVDQEPAQQPIG
ncbi:MAG: nitrilase-related carbon-nitrogen hydrolase [Geminicoccaceae bacterium]|nr:nitrilase-related carbon-nitrogen hydrolase [Geminicoccaceae bacterium]